MALIKLEVLIRGHRLRPKYLVHNKAERFAEVIKFTNDCLLDESEFEDTVKWAQRHMRTLLEEARDIEKARRERLSQD